MSIISVINNIIIIIIIIIIIKKNTHRKLTGYVVTVFTNSQ